MGLGIALRVFTASLFNRDVAERLRVAMDDIKQNGLDPMPMALAAPDEKPAATPAPAAKSAPPAKPVRSDAITLLSALQREARLVDLIQEDLTQFSDAQVGAAARPCLLSCGKTLQRMMPMVAVDDSGEGAKVNVPANSKSRYQWIGEPGSEVGTLIHKGWMATKIELPAWTGDDADANVVAAAQVQA